MLTGVHPFQRESELERVHAIIHSPASRLSETLDSDVAKLKFLAEKAKIRC